MKEENVWLLIAIGILKMYSILLVAEMIMGNLREVPKPRILYYICIVTLLLMATSCTTTPTVCIGSSLFESKNGVAVKWTGLKCEIKCEVK